MGYGYVLDEEIIEASLEKDADILFHEAKEGPYKKNVLQGQEILVGTYVNIGEIQNKRALHIT